MAPNFLHNFHVRLIYPKVRHSVIHTYKHREFGYEWKKAIESWYECNKDTLHSLVAIAVCGLEVYYVGHGWCVMWDEDKGIW